MRQRDETESPVPSFNIADPTLSRSIDALLAELGPYPHKDLLRELMVTAVKLAEEGCSRGDLKLLRSSVKELRYGFKVFARYVDFPKVSIFGSARRPPGDPEYETAKSFAAKMARHGYMIVTGAGPGIMAAGHEGAGREKSFGLNILLPFEQVANEFILGDDKLINFFYFFTRKLFFVKESDAIVLLPGGFGTHDEGFEVLTLIQTGKNEPTPVVFLDRPGGNYWTDWYEFVRTHLLERGYISPEDAHLFRITDNVDAACEEILTFYRRYHSSRYVDRKRVLVLRLREPIERDLIDRLNEEFRDILVKDSIQPCEPFPEESDEPELQHLPRLALHFNQFNFGRLRRLIDRINGVG